MFGDPVKKKTCLWLKNMPELVPDNEVDPEADIHYGEGRTHQKWISHGTANGRRVRRSKTFPGVARAMAEQWGSLV